MIRLLPILISSAAIAAPDYDFQWATIGDVGNRAVTQAEAPNLFDAGGNPIIGDVGNVDYAYRVSTTEVTNAQFAEFLNAYRPYVTGPPFDLGLTGLYIGYDSQSDSYFVGEGLENAAAAVSWRMAARYTNWLHNGKGTEQSDFETGVYDTSTFGRDPDTNQLTDQAVRDPNADFWIPNLSEWTKAMYWDPDRGPEGGYWLYHNGSDSPAVYDLPQNGGTSSGSTMFQLDVGSYGVTSPWGLLDGSGGERELLETFNVPGTSRLIAGSTWRGGPSASNDRIGAVGSTLPELDFVGFRVAGVVPAPGIPALVAGCLVWCSRRSRTA